MWNYLVRAYYAILYYLKKDNNSFEFKQIKPANKEIEMLYNKINVKNMYNDLHAINTKFNENSNVDTIIEFLDDESKIIFNNSDNLAISINIIKQNTYIISLLSQFKILKEIKILEEKQLYSKKNN